MTPAAPAAATDSVRGQADVSSNVWTVGAIGGVYRLAARTRLAVERPQAMPIGAQLTWRAGMASFNKIHPPPPVLAMKLPPLRGGFGR